MQKEGEERPSLLALQAGRDGETEEVLQELLQTIHQEEKQTPAQEAR